VGLFRAVRGHANEEGHPGGAHLSRWAVLAVGVVPLALAACGNSSASGSGTSTTTAAGKPSRAAYTACLKQHGVTLPSFGGRPGGGTTGGETPPSFTPGSGSFPGGTGGGGFRNNPKFAKAESACKSLRPSGGFGGFGGGAGGFNSSAFAAYRNCLKLHGVTLPTGGTRPTGSTPPTTSASEQAALQACAALRPTPSTTTTTAG
jgi:hypothetical protein